MKLIDILNEGKQLTFEEFSEKRYNGANKKTGWSVDSPRTVSIV